VRRFIREGGGAIPGLSPCTIQADGGTKEGEAMIRRRKRRGGG
jgi:hypothetical protein